MDNSFFIIEDKPTITIGRSNECAICGCEFKYKKININYAGKTPEGLYEVVMKTEHPRCKQIKTRMEKAQKEILDCEFELFCKRFNEVKNN